MWPDLATNSTFIYVLSFCARCTDSIAPLHRVPITGGYCWPTPQDRNWCAQPAFFEGKKAEEISPRKSTPRTLKEVDQQYPGGFRAHMHVAPTACHIGRLRNTRYHQGVGFLTETPKVCTPDDCFLCCGSAQTPVSSLSIFPGCRSRVS
jgi:hypothetical protein